MSLQRVAILLTLVGAASSLPAVRAAPTPPRRFADRPVAWREHDDVRNAPAPVRNDIEDLQLTLAIRDSLPNEIDRILALEGSRPALDVNAADEVPCSTWFCPRNHLTPMSPEEVARGTGEAPRPPLTISDGKEEGQSIGFIVRDAGGRKFLVKLDPPGHFGMAIAGEIVGNLVFHAAGYNVPGAFIVDLSPADLRIAPSATRTLFKVERRPLTEAWLRKTLRAAPRGSDGRWRAVAVRWIEGHPIGSFDMQGRRPGDPNDLIPHEQRRSLRASWVPFAWLSVVDAGAINTLDTVITEDSHSYLRHYFIDFNAAFGSSTDKPQGLHQDGEYVIEIGRTLAALFSFGLYQRPFQKDRDEYDRLVLAYPAIGYYPAESFDPDQYRQNRKSPAFVRMTDRDAYWGAKVVTSFSDAQLAAVVAAARLPADDARYLEHALEVRRDVIGRRYLRAISAVERPSPSDDGRSVCFDDLAISRGYAAKATTRYRVTIVDGDGLPFATDERPSEGGRTCVPLGPLEDVPARRYRVVEVRTIFDARVQAATRPRMSKASRIHLQWRDGAHRFVVVGLDREE
jgi:hypothetical protein